MADVDTQKLFLGVEISTQQLKVIAVQDDLQIIYEDGVKFDTDLPHYKTQNGAHVHEDGLTVTAPTLMWIEALDMALGRMKDEGFQFNRVAAMSGTGQQHGSVYWKKGAAETLSSLNPAQAILSQLKESFTVKDSPIWMDSSTGAQCRLLEDAAGGAQNLADITGSSAYERFTGNQIAKIAHTQHDAYISTERISLVSSFGACLFIGGYAPIDESDGSGMNLMDIRKRQWDSTCLKASAPDLSKRLGDIVPSSQVVGSVSTYMCERYGFSSDCQVVAFTGDNPASVAGMRLRRGDVIVSLGTSDTLFLWLDEPRPALEGHIFVNPVDTKAYMALLCYKNGSLTREQIRDKSADGSWQQFETLLSKTPAGNNGNIGIYYNVQEITPNAVGYFRFDGSQSRVASFSPEVEVRAVIEGQFIAKRLHAEKLGYKLGANTRILATGGASSNKAILKVLADVFNAPVYIQDVANSACLGCAYRAKQGYMGGVGMNFEDVVAGAPEFTCAAQPSPNSSQVYDPLVKVYRELEDKFVRKL